MSILGNNARNKNLICQYCGTVMDVKNNFKALYSFTQVQQHTHLSISQSIAFENTPFTIVGYISYTSRDSQFVAYQLYSTSHGYAMLIDKDKELIFFRKTHYLPNKNLWMLQKGEAFNSNKMEFIIKSFELGEVYYAAGNLLENTKQGKRSKHCFAYCKKTKHWFYSQHSKNAVNYYLGSEFIADKF